MYDVLKIRLDNFMESFKILITNENQFYEQKLKLGGVLNQEANIQITLPG